jgi:hypothetical protein
VDYATSTPTGRLDGDEWLQSDAGSTGTAAPTVAEAVADQVLDTLLSIPLRRPK